MRTSLKERIQAGMNTTTTNNISEDACVVMCPPHPQYGGTRHDSRLKTLTQELTKHKISSLRFDYGEWSGGTKEVQDAVEAVELANQDWAETSLFGYSFGAGIAARASTKTQVSSLALLAPPPDAAEHITDIPTYVIAGKQDTTLDSSPVTDLVENHEWLDSNHFFTNHTKEAAEKFANFYDSIH